MTMHLSGFKPVLFEYPQLHHDLYLSTRCDAESNMEYWNKYINFLRYRFWYVFNAIIDVKMRHLYSQYYDLYAKNLWINHE